MRKQLVHRRACTTARELYAPNAVNIAIIVQSFISHNVQLVRNDSIRGCSARIDLPM